MKRSARLAAFVLGIGLATLPGAAIYMQPDLQQVPVARLVANLERELGANPTSDVLHLRLARLYGMAYAANTDELPVTTLARGQKEEVWFGHEPSLVPYITKTGPDEKRAASKTHLQKAIDHYRKSLAINPGSLLARIGYGWALQHAGDKAGAAAEYRRVVESAWPKEQGAKAAGLGQRFYTQEAAEYLIPLLDPRRDAAEIAELRNRSRQLAALPRPITPIAIPLVDGATAAQMVDLDAQVPFDADGSGLRRRWTWISPDAAGWLVYDARQAGQVTSGLQLFGDVTWWLFWNNGYEALGALDDDGDRMLKGRELRYLALWIDADGDGASDAGEVRPLAAHGIAALSCRYEAADRRLIAASSREGVTFADGRVRPTYDVMLRPASSVSAPAPD